MASNQEKVQKLLDEAVEGDTNPITRYQKTVAALDKAFADGLLAIPAQYIMDEIVITLAPDIRAVKIDCTFSRPDWVTPEAVKP